MRRARAGRHASRMASDETAVQRNCFGETRQPALAARGLNGAIRRLACQRRQDGRYGVRSPLWRPADDAAIYPDAATDQQQHQ